MPLWVSDFLGDTLDLDANEIGAYMLLLMAQWNRDGGSLPDDAKKLQRVARCGRNWPKVWGNISRYFKTDENGIYSVRLRLEAQNVAAKREVNAHNGARGGAAKALKTHNVDLANATNSLQRNPSIPEPEPYKLDTNVSRHAKEKRGVRLSEDWQLDQDYITAALEIGLSEEGLKNEADKFRDYWISKTGQAAVKRDWLATWRNWCRNTKTRSATNNSGGKSRSHVIADAVHQAGLRGFD